MSRIESALLDIGGLDQLAAQDTPIHRLDPRAKVITALAFILTVVSFGKYDITGPLPLLIYPVILVAIGDLPPGYLMGKILLASPFALLLGMFNPLLDRVTLMQLGAFEISGGWISFASILLRFFLTLSAALILISTTGFNALCLALEWLKVPKILVVQLMMLYRYLFVLAQETIRMRKAWSLRALSPQRMPLSIFISLIGQLLLRALDRAQHIHMAMLCRGFTGTLHLTHPLRFGTRDVMFILIWCSVFALLRFYSLTRLLGEFALEFIR